MSAPSAPLAVHAVIKTPQGDLGVHLYADTPIHRDNFLKLVNEKFYDGLQFHRVISQFMIQGGDPQSRNPQARGPLGAGDVGYTLEAEIRADRFHKRGALAAARTGDEVNPERRSSGCQFYIVQGKRYRPMELDAMEDQLREQQFQGFIQQYLRQPEQQWIIEAVNQLRNPALQHLQQADPAAFEALNQRLQAAEDQMRDAFAREADLAGFSDSQKATYTDVGGAPFLDGSYTVFGEVVYGLDVIDAIAMLPTDGNDQPTSAVRMTVVPGLIL